MTARNSSGFFDVPRRLFGLIDRRDRWLLLILLVATIISALLEVVSVAAILPLFQLMLDPGWIQRVPIAKKIFGDHLPSEALLWACIAILIVFVVKISFSLFAGWLRLEMQSRIYQQLSSRLLQTYMYRPISFHLQHGSAELLRNITSYVGQVCQYGLLGSADLVSDSLLCLGIFCALFIVEPLVSSLALLGLGFVALVYLALGRRHFHKWGERYKRSSAAMYQSGSDALIGIKTIKVFGREQFFGERYRKNAAEFSNILRNNSFAGLIPRQILELAAVGALVVPIAWMVSQGREPATLLSTLAVFAAAAYRIMPSVVRIVTAIQGFRFGQQAFEVVFSDFQQARNVSAKSHTRRWQSGRGDILLKGVTFRYGGAKDLSLDAVDLEIKRGEVVALVGMSGAGKTTLADLILGLHKPDAGTLTIGDMPYGDIGDVPDGVFGYVPQDPFLIDDSIRRNIALGVQDDAIDEARLRQVVAMAALDQFIERLPAGSDTVVGDRGVRLSGGQRQRIGIARALYVDPDALVLDEATSSVDVTTETEITEAINQLRGKKTLIIIAHRLSTVRECDRIFFLEDGRLVASGRFGELVQSNAHFSEMVRQMGFVLQTPGVVA